MEKYKGIIFTFIGIIFIVGLIWFLQTSSKGNVGGNNSGTIYTKGTLSADESSFNFGNVSMAAGKVSHNFKVKNTGAEPVSITKVYTSCMCTQANLMGSGVKLGPFGMEGMGYIPTINEVLQPGEEEEVQAVFDPAAHGPAGLGHIERAISVETSGKILELSFQADVTP